MNIFTDLIKKTAELLAPLPCKTFVYSSELKAAEGEINQLILGKEAAYELGAANFDAVNYTAITRDEELVPCDEVCVYGPNLCDIKENCSFARITILRNDDIEVNGEEGAHVITTNIEPNNLKIAPRRSEEERLGKAA